jgi:hypothetical protein
MSSTGTSKGYSSPLESRPTTIHKAGYSAEIVREMVFGKECYRYLIRQDGHSEVIKQGVEASLFIVLDFLSKEELDNCHAPGAAAMREG